MLREARLSSWAATTWQRNYGFRSAKASWRDTVIKRPDNGRAWNHLGLAPRETQELVGAETAFRESIRLDPNKSLAQFNLANLFFGQGKSNNVSLVEEIHARGNLYAAGLSYCKP